VYDNILKHVNDKGRSLCWDDCHLKKSMQDGEPRERSIYLRHKQGHRVLVNVRSILLRDDADFIQCSVEVFTRGGLETNFEQFKDLARKAFIDSLTGIPNKDYITNKLKSLLLSKAPNAEEAFGVMLIELDNLKKTNDEYGMNIGNAAIKVIAKTILENLQPGDLIARMGGGLFMVITTIDKKSILLNWANKLNLLVQQSIIPEQEELFLKVGIGGLIVKTGENIDLIHQGLEEELKNSMHVAISISIRE
jgi:diguanylate cyclase (GGDEF)-like protein